MRGFGQTGTNGRSGHIEKFLRLDAAHICSRTIVAWQSFEGALLSQRSWYFLQFHGMRENMDQSTMAAGNSDRDCLLLNEESGKLFAAATGAQRHRSRGRLRRDNLHLALDAMLLPGLGCASVSKNGEPVIELEGLAGEHAMTVGDAERLALAEPDQEWCIHMVSLLDDRHYRRESAGLWRLYARGYGLS
jgi:hypothetical protein